MLESAKNTTSNRKNIKKLMVTYIYTKHQKYE